MLYRWLQLVCWQLEICAVTGGSAAWRGSVPGGHISCLAALCRSAATYALQQQCRGRGSMAPQLWPLVSACHPVQ